MELLANEKKFRELLKAHGHSIQSLANVVGCDRTMISKIVNGKAIPGHKLLSKILFELQVSYEELFTETEDTIMAGRPKKYTKLEEMTIIQIHEKIKDVSTVKKQAEKLGVSLAEWNTFKYKPTNKKRLDALKKADQKKQADLEMGLEIQDEPIVKTKAVEPLKENALKGASTIPVVETIEKSKYDNLKKKFDELEILEAGRRQETEVEKNEKLKVIAENERLRDQIERLKKNKAEAEEQQKKSTSELNERSRKAENLMRAAETRVKQLENEVERLKEKNAVITNNAMEIDILQRQLEKERADEVAKYEQSLKQLEQEVQQLDTERDDWKGKYIDLDNAYKALEADYEEVSKAQETKRITLNADEIKAMQSQIIEIPKEEMSMTLIDPPAHYKTADGTDLIKRFADKKKRDMFIGAMVFNINKYCERFGEKDNELSEARKMKDYSTRLVEYLEQEELTKVHHEAIS